MRFFLLTIKSPEPIWLKCKRTCSIILTQISFFCIVAISASFARPCYPNDPEGENPGNLCLTFPPTWTTLPNTASDQAPFVQGTGVNAFYGYPVSPNQPGKYVGKTSGYWTNIEAVNGITRITDSNGKIYDAPSQP